MMYFGSGFDPMRCHLLYFLYLVQLKSFYRLDSCYFQCGAHVQTFSMKSMTCCSYNFGTPVVCSLEFFFFSVTPSSWMFMLSFHHMYASIWWYYESMNINLDFYALFYNIFINMFYLLWWINSCNMLILTLSFFSKPIYN